MLEHATPLPTADSKDTATMVTPTNDNSNPQQGTGTEKETPSKDNRQQAKPQGSSEISQSNFKKEARKLFVGGLPTDITEPEFRTFFSQFGELEDAIVMFDRETKCSRGFGFVTYVDQEVAQSLLRMGDGDDGVGRLTMRGKTCEVKEATPKGDMMAHRPGRNARGRRDQRQKHHRNHYEAPYVYAEPLGGHGGTLGYYPHSIPGYVTPMYPSHVSPPLPLPVFHPAHPHFYVPPTEPLFSAGTLSPANQQYSSTYPQQAAYAFVPVVPASTAPLSHLPPSVMQAVEPGILSTSKLEAEQQIETPSEYESPN